MTEITRKGEQSVGSLGTLRAELDEVRRRVAVSDEEIDLLQVEAARNKRKWYREPSVLVATFALVISICTFVVGQVNIKSERQIEYRNQLTALLAQLPTALTENWEKPNTVANDLVQLVAGSAAELIGKLHPEASTATEKMVVASALFWSGGDMSLAKRLATAAEQQSIRAREKAAGAAVIGQISFLAGDFAGGRAAYRRAISLVQSPEAEVDSPVLRDIHKFNILSSWVSDEFSYTKSCSDATERLLEMKETLNRLPSDRTVAQKTSLDDLTKMVTAVCPIAGQ